MTAYSVTLNNQTSSVWSAVVFISIPDASGMLSVAWQISSPVAPSGGSGSVSWTDDPAACIGTGPTGVGVQVFKQSLARAAAPNQGWSVENNSGALDLTLTGRSVTPNQIEITNRSGKITNAALGYSGTAAVYSPQLPSGVAAGFFPVPSYWLLVTQSSVVPGQVVSYATTPEIWSLMLLTTTATAGQFLPPQPLAFPTNEPAAVATIASSGAVVSVTISYGTT